MTEPVTALTDISNASYKVVDDGDTPPIEQEIPSPEVYADLPDPTVPEDDDEEDDETGFTEEEAIAFLSQHLDFSVIEEQLVAAATPDEEHTGAMIALVPRDEDAMRLALPGGESEDELHLTLFYLGEGADYAPATRAHIINEIMELAQEQSAITANVFGAAAWNPDGDSPSCVMSVGGDQPGKVRCAVEDTLGEVWAATLPEQHCPWVMHICVAYNSNPAMFVKPALANVGPVVFDRIRVAFAGEVTDIPLYDGGEVLAAAGEPNDGGQSMAQEDTAPAEAPAQTPVENEPAKSTGRPPAPENAQPEPINASVPGAWEGVITVEGLESGDGRMFSPGSLVWDNPPMPFMWQKETSHGGGTDVSVRVGSIDEVWRDGTLIRARGTFDLGSADGAEAHRRMGNGFLDGTSVDVDSVKDADVEFVYPEMPDEKKATDDEMMQAMFASPELMIFHSGRIRGTTLVEFPAFTEARLSLVAQSAESVTASLTDIPMNPLKAWMSDPRFDAPTAWTVLDNGQVFGHAALKDTCHASFGNACVVVPTEDSHDHFLLGELVTAEGDRVSVGQITMGTGHASIHGLDARAAAAHYDNTGTVVADVVSGFDRFGLWVAGALRPGISAAQVRELRGAKLSGDWRRLGGKLRLVAILAVNVPGFGVPRLQTHVVEGRQLSLVASGLVPDHLSSPSVVNAAGRLESLRARVQGTPVMRVAALRKRVLS